MARFMQSFWCMLTLIPTLSLVLGLLLSLFLTLSAHWAHRASEQVRLDAYSLSLCHHRKNYIETKILSRNEEIRSTQLAMDALAASCVLAPSAQCVTAKAELKLLSKKGQALEMMQDLQIQNYSRIERNLMQDLELKNSLDRSKGRLERVRSPAPLFLGFKREQVSTERLLFENLFSVTWPRSLEIHPRFEFNNQFEFTFHPHRTLIGVNKPAYSSSSSDERNWLGLIPKLHENSQAKEARSLSGCLIRVDGKESLRVERSR